MSTLRGRTLHVQTHAGWRGRRGAEFKCSMPNPFVPAVIEIIIVLKAPNSAFNKEQQTEMYRLREF